MLNWYVNYINCDDNSSPDIGDELFIEHCQNIFNLDNSILIDIGIVIDRLKKNNLITQFKNNTYTYFLSILYVLLLETEGIVVNDKFDAICSIENYESTINNLYSLNQKSNILYITEEEREYLINSYMVKQPNDKDFDNLFTNLQI